MIPFLRKLSWWAPRHGKEDELREEIQFHLDEDAEECQADGWAADLARTAAHRDLGNVTLLQGTTRTFWTFALFEQLGQDLRYALRSMINNRAVNLSINGQAEIASGELVSGDYFKGLAVIPASGRLTIPDDDRAGAVAVAVIVTPSAKNISGVRALPRDDPF